MADRFYRGSNVGDVGPPGAGLGLHIAKSIIEAHGGAIDVESEPGQGTRVTGCCPLPGTGAWNPCLESAMNVLLVEDNERIIEFVRRGLQAEGCQVDVARRGLDGLRRARSGARVIILDLLLPDIDGQEVCRRLREAGVTTPILMLTALDTLETRCVACGSAPTTTWSSRSPCRAPGAGRRRSRRRGARYRARAARARGWAISCSTARHARSGAASRPLAADAARVQRCSSA